MKKHLIVSLTIGACLLLPSAGVVFATDPHIAPSANGTGQPGTGGVGIQCGPGMGVSTQPQPPTPPPGQATGGGGFINSSSPFSSSAPAYAGSTGNPTASVMNGGKGVGNPATSNSQYDVACFQVH